MNIRIALVFAGILIATSSGVARAALQPIKRGVDAWRGPGA